MPIVETKEQNATCFRACKKGTKHLIISLLGQNNFNTIHFRGRFISDYFSKYAPLTSNKVYNRNENKSSNIS